MRSLVPPLVVQTLQVTLMPLQMVALKGPSPGHYT